MSLITHFLEPPVFQGDEAKTRLAGLINVITKGFAAFAVLVLVGNAAGGKSPVFTVMINLLAIVAVLPVNKWLHRGHLVFAQVWLLSVMFVCVTAAVATIGTIRAPIAAIYPAGVVIAGLLFDRKGILYATALCSLAFFGLITAENAGLLPKPAFRVGITQWVTYTALCGFTGALVYAMNQITRDALVRAERELVQRKNAEAALSVANQQLSRRIGEVEKLQAELSEQALRDELTGLYNRRYLKDVMDRELVRSDRDQRSLSFVLLDVDHFKVVNDTWGHPAGDQILVQLAQLLTTHARASDIVCRYGGEEFLLLMPGTGIEFAYNRAEEIRQKAALLLGQKEALPIGVTLSIGIAAYPDHGRDWEELVQKADGAMYRSKRNGRNRVTIWQSDAQSN